jgi:NADH:ubiquinone oxidoreductase subunit 3 (subunit A)
MSQFFYHAYEISSKEHLPVAFLAALVMLVLGTQQTATSFRREKLRAASGVPTAQTAKLRLQVAYTTLVALLFVAASVLMIILRHRLS